MSWTQASQDRHSFLTPTLGWRLKYTLVLNTTARFINWSFVSSTRFKRRLNLLRFVRIDEQQQLELRRMELAELREDFFLKRRGHLDPFLFGR